MQTGAFLDHAAAADDDRYALYHLVAYRGLRRGEACGLHWTDVDLDSAQLTVRWQLAQLGWATSLKAPETDSSEDVVALDAETVAALRAHRRRQRKQRLAAGPAWVDSGLVFTTPTGQAVHPAEVTDHFQHLARQAGLPPIRLHNLRHGAATLALAAGVDMKPSRRYCGTPPSPSPPTPTPASYPNSPPEQPRRPPRSSPDGYGRSRMENRPRPDSGPGRVGRGRRCDAPARRVPCRPHCRP